MYDAKLHEHKTHNMNEEIKKIIEELLSRTALTYDAIDMVVADDGTTWCMVKSQDSKLFIGKNGETLESLNHLIRKLIEQRFRDTPLPYQVVLDVNEYQKKKVDNIKAIAHMMAERARFFKASVSVDPMNAFERKIIHTFLENAKNVKTESAGLGHERHVVIKYVDDTI